MNNKPTDRFDLERIEGPGSILSGAGILFGQVVTIRLGNGLEVFIGAKDAKTAADVASYLGDCAYIDDQRVQEVAICRRMFLRTPTRPNGA